MAEYKERKCKEQEVKMTKNTEANGLLEQYRQEVTLSKQSQSFRTQFKSRWKYILESFLGTDVEKEAIEWVASEWNLTPSDLRKYYNHLEVVKFLGEYPKSADDFVEKYIVAKGIIKNFDGLTNPDFLMGNCSLAALNSKLYAYNIDYSLGYDKRRLEIALEDWDRNALNFRMLELYDSLNDRKIAKDEFGKAEAEWNKFVSIVESNPDRREYTKVILKHFIWNTKRMMCIEKCHSTFNPIMPVFVGLTGNGKSSTVEHFLSPLKNGAFIRTDFEKLLDSKYYLQNATIPVAFLDEMSRLTTVDQNRLKAFITSDKGSDRVMYSHIVDNQRKIIQLIGTSNHSLAAISNDTTSSRRFYEIDTPHDMKSANPNWYEKIDWMLLWKSVDGKSPLTSEINEKIFEFQHNEQRKKNYVEDWIWSEHITGEMKATKMFDDWQSWAETKDQYNFKNVSMTAFFRLTTTIPGITKKVKSDGKWYKIDIDTTDK